MKNLAIVSPSLTNSPETFVQSHINGIQANVYYYYGNLIPSYLDGEGLFSMNYEHLRNKKAWLSVIKRINFVNYKRSGLNLKEYLFARSLKEHHIDVVMAEYGTTSAEILNVCKYCQIPLVAHFHGRDSSDYSVIERYKEKYSELFNYASSVIVVSKEMKRRLIDMGCSPSIIEYVPCVPDDCFYQSLPSYDSQQFFFVGRFTDKKAPYAVVYAFSKIVGDYPDAKLVMAGDGPLLNSTKNLAKLFGLEDCVVFCGRISPPQTIEYMKNSFAYIQHSIIADDGDMEGTPVAVMEASAIGLPVISTFHAGIPDIIIDKQTGLLSNELDVNTMADNMKYLLENKDIAISMGRNGKKRMKEEFSKKDQMEKLTRIIENASNIKS